MSVVNILQKKIAFTYIVANWLRISYHSEKSYQHQLWDTMQWRTEISKMIAYIWEKNFYLTLLKNVVIWFNITWKFVVGSVKCRLYFVNVSVCEMYITWPCHCHWNMLSGCRYLVLLINKVCVWGYNEVGLLWQSSKGFISPSDNEAGLG